MKARTKSVIVQTIVAVGGVFGAVAGAYTISDIAWKGGWSAANAMNNLDQNAAMASLSQQVIAQQLTINELRKKLEESQDHAASLEKKLAHYDLLPTDADWEQTNHNFLRLYGVVYGVSNASQVLAYESRKALFGELRNMAHYQSKVLAKMIETTRSKKKEELTYADFGEMIEEWGKNQEALAKGFQLLIARCDELESKLTRMANSCRDHMSGAGLLTVYRSANPKKDYLMIKKYPEWGMDMANGDVERIAMPSQQ